MRTRGVLLRIVWAAVLAAGLPLGGCMYIGYAASAIPNKIEARYTPPKTPLLVLVENKQNPGTMVTEADQLSSFIMEDLRAHKVAPLVELKKLYEARDQEKDFDKLKITQIGKAVGAQQVLYVDLRRFNVNEDDGGGIPLHARIEATVRMVDVQTGVTTFPAAGQADWPVSMETSITSTVSRSSPEAVRESLLRSAGSSIGRLFHVYYVEQ